MEKSVKDPLVSIVIPVYNGAKYIKDAIDSALAQTYKNIEIIVVNDGSTDNTEKIVKAYGNKVRYFKQKNGGVSTALNLGIKKMKGQYFSWLSHDDKYMPNKVSCEVKFLKKHNYLDKKIIVFSDYSLMDQSGKHIQKVHIDHKLVSQKPEYILMRERLNGLSLLIPKSAFDTCGLFDTKLRCVQDYEKWRVMQKTYTFLHIPECLVVTRLHPEQTTHSRQKELLEEGTALHIRLIKDVPKKRKAELEGSEYRFFDEAMHYHQFYKKVSQYCQRCKRQLLQKESKYKVSVLILCSCGDFNVQESLKSLKKQTVQNYEIIMVGSKHPIRGYKTTKSLMAGLEESTGRYVAFLYAGDEFKNDKLETSFDNLLLKELDAIQTSYELITNNGTKIVYLQSNPKQINSLSTLLIQRTLAKKIKGISQFNVRKKHTFPCGLYIPSNYCQNLNIPLSKVFDYEAKLTYVFKKASIFQKILFLLNAEGIKPTLQRIKHKALHA